MTNQISETPDTTTIQTSPAPQGDYLVRGIAENGMVRAFAVTARSTVQELSTRHQASPLVTAALGRLAMAGQMMGSMMKSDDELLTLMVHGDGPIGPITVTANANGDVKGYAAHHDVWLPLKRAGKLDVGAGVGEGTLTVIRDIPGVEPYTSQTELVTGEIGDDLTHYFVLSDQVPTSVGVGVLIDTDLSVKCAGGFIVQLMPGHYEYLVEMLERNLSNIDSVTKMLSSGMSPEDILNEILDGMDFHVLDTMPVRFYCGCNGDRAERATMALGEDEIRDMIAKGEPAEVYCHFCGNRYTLDASKLQDLLWGTAKE